MIQGGGFEPGMNQKSHQTRIQKRSEQRSEKYPRYAGRWPVPGASSATAQFFINVADNDFLNFSGESLQGWGYCVFAGSR